MKYLFTFLIIFLLSSMAVFAQVGISTDNSAPDNSAMLDVKSTTKGFLPPRMTTLEMNSIPSPVVGLLVYNTTVNSLYWFDGSAWKRFNEPYTEVDPVFNSHPASGITTGNITNWSTAYSNRILNATGTAPLTLSISSNQLSGSIYASDSTTNGYLTSADWNIFNNKQNTLTFGNLTSNDITISGGNDAVKGTGATLAINKGNITSADMTVTGGSNSVLGTGTALTINKGNLTETGSSVLTISGGGSSVLGTGASIQVKQASASQSGYLNNTDWTTFNNKQNALSFGNASSSDISITGGSGAVIGSGMNLTVNKGNLTETGSSVLTITGGSNSVLGGGSAIQVKQANVSQSGYLSTADWNNFNNKVSSQWVTNGQDISYNTGKVGIGTSTPVSSAVMEVSSTTSGVLLPRMSYDQRKVIVSPAEGLMVFCTNCGLNGALSIYSNNAWRTFIPCSSAPPTPGVNALSPGQIIWNWNTVAGAVGYKWNTTNNYGSAIEMNTATSKTETGISCGTTYARYAWSYNECEISVPVTLTQTVSAVVPEPPSTGTHMATQISIVWNWNTVPDAIGYKWNTTDDFASATEMGTATTKTETGLVCVTPYTRYVWAYNGCGYSLVTSLNQSTGPCFAIGQPYGGGVIFYLDGTGQHGLISATTNQSTGAPWGCYGTSVPGTSTAIGTGQANTTFIVNGCSGAGLAARICDDLVLNGYSDWFLPSKDELNQMYVQKTAIGGFAVNFYWSSSEYSATTAWYQYFDNGNQVNYNKNDTFYVRAVRAF